jgi:DNA-binding CsgD family transcriptional regulator
MGLHLSDLVGGQQSSLPARSIFFVPKVAQMIHVASLIHFLSASAGWGAVVLCLLIYAKYRKPFVLLCMLFSMSLSFMLMGVAIGHYGTVARINTTALMMWCGAVGANLFIGVIPPLVHRFLGIPFGRRLWMASAVFDSVVVLVSIAYLTVLPRPLILVLLQAALFAAMAYGVIVGIAHAKALGASGTQRYAVTLFVSALVFLPLLAADAFMGELPFLPFNLTLPVFLLLICLELALFAIFHLDRPPFAAGTRLTSYCVDTLGLTAREKEIVEALLEASTNKEISDKLFISPKTVENHLVNIYKKAEVRSRAQLVSLIHANSSN